VGPLTRVERATKRRAEAERDWRDAIRAARREGASLRAIAGAAGVTHVRVVQIVRDSPAIAHGADDPLTRREQDGER
jgi:hypothetical protein